MKTTVRVITLSFLLIALFSASVTTYTQEETRFLPVQGEIAIVETRDGRTIYTYPSVEVVFGSNAGDAAGGKAALVYSSITNWKSAQSWTYLKKTSTNDWWICAGVADFKIGGIFVGTLGDWCDWRHDAYSEVKQGLDNNWGCVPNQTWYTKSHHYAVNPRGKSWEADNSKTINVPCG